MVVPSVTHVNGGFLLTASISGHFAYLPIIDMVNVPLAQSKWARTALPDVVYAARLRPAYPAGSHTAGAGV